MSFFHSPNIVTNGLVLALDAANPKSYPGTGTTWTDVSGNGNNGTLNNGVGFSPSYKGILTFDGADDDVRTTLFTNARTNVTMAGWFFVNLGTVGTFLSNGDDPGGYCVGIGQYFGTADNQIVGLFGYVRWLLTGAYYQYTGWHHIAMTLDGSGTPSIYVNGVLIGTYPGSMANTPSPGSGFSIGSQWGIRYANTKCGNSTFYNRALTATEILQNYNATQQRFVYAYSEGNNAAPYVANWNNTTTYTMNQFGGLGKVNAHGFSSGPVTYTLTLSSLPAHTEVRYKVFWHLVDSLDNETNQLFTMNSAGGETEKLRFTKQYNLEPAISVQDSGVIASWSGHQTYTYRPWAGGYYQQDGYLSIDTGWYSHTATSFTARHVMGADQGQTDEAEYLSHVQVYLR
jgi:hypothetical protein